jgi:hypothetical protein
MQIRTEMTPAEAELAQKAHAELSLRRPVIVNFEGTAESPKGGAWFIFQRDEGRPPLRAFLTHHALKAGISVTLAGWGPEFLSKLQPLRTR